MGAGCCKEADEINPDGKPKDPQTKEQRKEDPKDLRRAALAADWSQMRVLLRRMPLRQICSGAEKKEATGEELGNTALHNAVSINHLRGVKKLLRYGIPPGIRNKAGKTPLHLALEAGRLKAAWALLEKDMALRNGTGGTAAQATTVRPYLMNIQDRHGVSPLLAVVAAGRLKLTREVLGMCKELEVSVDFALQDSEGNSLLSYAAKWGWWDELEAWLDKVADPARLLNTQNKQGETILGYVLLFAASPNLLPSPRARALVSRLLSAGALAVLPAFQERVPLLALAAVTDDMELYNMLRSKGADPLKARDTLGRSPLHFAAARGALQLAGQLLDAGLKAYALDAQRNTPLHLASMRGQKAMVDLLLERADDKIKALLTPNKSGMSAYHLALTAGSSDKAQSSSLALIDALGPLFTSPVLGRKKAVVNTPLLLAIQGHQDRVVRALLAKGCSPNEANWRGEIPLARVLACATGPTYETDSAILDMLIGAGADIGAAGEATHPMIAICKNKLSKFAENAVRVLSERCGTLDWDKRDDKGYTPLGLAAFHNNAWLVRYLIDEVGLDPNSHEQATRATAPEVVGTTGVLCLAKLLTQPGTVEGQTPLMCAAKGASLDAVQLLLNRGADVNAVDSLGRTPLQHAMHMDKPESLQVAAALLQFGARPERGIRQPDTQVWKQCLDLVGEGWPHRAVRYGCSSFLALWAGCGGNLELLATTADDADDMPGAELKVEEKGDFLDYMPGRTLNQLEEEDAELLDDYNGRDSEETPAEEDGEGGKGPAPDAAGAVAESLERRRSNAGSSSEEEEDCGEDAELAEALAAGQATSFYPGPTPRMMLRWRRRNLQWWDDFWEEKSGLPDLDLEDDPHDEDKYTLCEEGDDWIDEEDVEDEIWEGIRAEQRAAATEYRRQQRMEQQQQEQQGVEGAAEDSGAEVLSRGIQRASNGLAHRLFRRRLPGAAVPPEDARDADEGTTFAAGSPSKWLRRQPSATNGGGQMAAAAATAARLQPVQEARTAAGPVSEGVEDVLVEDIEEAGDDTDSRSDDIKAAAMDTDKRRIRVSSTVGRDGVVFNQEEDRAPLGVGGSSVGGVSTNYRTSGSLSLTATSNASKSVKQSLSMTKGKLTGGTSGEKLYGNEEYYQPETRYLGVPRYMNVDVSMQPPHVYEKIVADFHARVRAFDFPEDKLLVGPELRARNILWYHKSMSPVEYPLKQGKWKSFQRLSGKAVEESKLRRPRKPGEKPKFRNKKGGWFGIAPLPSRPELAATTPLLYAVRLARRKCVQVLLQYSGASASIPDAHGFTPLSYAMFMLAKERHNKTLQQITDLLLASRPLVNPAAIWKLQLRPRIKAEIEELEAAAAAKGGDSKISRRVQEKRAMYDMLTTHYAPERFPSIMEPLVLAALLGDVQRMTVLIKELGANVNSAWVWLPDIPTYFRGQWEKQVGRCHSRVTALHVAIGHKKFETVRALLDLGSDPNLAGAEYTGDYAKDLARQIKLQREREEAMRRSKDAGAAHNPYVKLWQDKTSSLLAIFSAIKRFLSSIEIPGLTRPHPWLSPLHLAARLGAADVAFLLLQRGALANGGPAGAAAPRSPLEEALLYARANAQSYGTASNRANYHRILELACLEKTPNNAADIQQALQKQLILRTGFTQQLREKATALAAKLPMGKDGKAATADTVLSGVKAVLDVGASLADYSRAGLEKLPLPNMNLTAVANLSKKMIKDALAMMDPIKGSIKAVVFAAKIIVKLLLEMMRRPIAHHDPALACAHVLLYFRAPINVSEKQSGILVRDILDNGQSFPGADTRLSYYRWLGISPAAMSDDVWVATVVNKLAVLKTNISYGYMVLDLTTDPKEYERKKKKFMSAVESAVLNIGTANLMPYYLRHVIEEAVDVLQPASTSRSATREAAAIKAQQALKRRILWSYDEVAAARGQQVGAASGSISRTVLERLFGGYIDFMAAMRMRELQPEAEATGGGTAEPGATAPSAPTTEIADDVARSLLPQWLYAATDDASGAAVPDAPRTRAAVVDFLVNRFLHSETSAPAPKDFTEAPVPNFWDKLLDPESTELKFEWPSIPPEKVEAMRPTLEDVSDMDVCAAVVRAINALTVQRSTALSRTLLEEASAAAKTAEEAFAQRLSAAAAEKAQRIQEMLETRLELIQFDEGPIFEAALMAPMWDAAAQKLGGGPAAQALVGQLRSAVASGQLPPIDDPLELARKLGADVMELDPGELLAQVEAQLGRALPPRLAMEITQALTSPIDAFNAALESSPATAGSPEVSTGQSAPADLESFVERAEDELGSSAASVLRGLQEAAAAAQVKLDPDVLAGELIESIRQNGGQMLVSFWEKKLGRVPPDSVRTELEKSAKPFAEQLMAKYEEGGLSAAIGAATLITGGVAVAVSSGLVEEVYGKATTAINKAMLNIESKTGLVLPEVHKLSDLTDPERLVATAGTVRDQVEDAVQSFDIGTAAQMAADGEIKLPGTLGTTTAVAGELFQRVVTGQDPLAAVETAADKAQATLQDALEGDPSAALSAIAGKTPLPKHLAKVSQVLDMALKEANTELTGLANTAKQLEESVGALTSGTVQDLDGLNEQLVAAGDQLLSTMENQLGDAADKMMAGFELMMSVDVQALAAELEEAREALMHIMEVLSIDEMI